jgi:hypothetical protein
MTRIVVVTNLLEMTAPDTLVHSYICREMGALADKLNDALPDYEVMLAHLNGDDCLMFTRRECQQETDAS